MTRQPIALQLYTVRSEAAADLFGTLRTLREAGYEAVEFAGYHGHEPQAIRRELDQLGMQAIGAHTPIAALEREFDRTIEELKVLGGEFATVPWIAPDDRPTSVSDAQRLAQTLNGWALRARAVGVRLGYHNHEFEFLDLGGRTVYDVLIAETEPSLVDLQLDAYWAVFAGMDPVALLGRLSGRAPLLHVKDMEIVDGERRDVPVGRGVIDWTPILSAAQDAGTQWFIAEQDHPRQPLPDVAESYRALHTLLESGDRLMSNDYVDINRAAWDRFAADFVATGEREWASPEPTWGIFSLPESDVRLLPDDLAGKDVIELGCGTAYVSAWLARRGARPTGIDNSPKQLETARRLQQEHGIEFPLLLGNAEATGLPDGSFDIAISEYGASIWCDPYKWIPEAARLLRPGGELIFLVNGTLLMLCSSEDPDAPVSERLERPYFGMHRFSWSEEDGVEFHIGYGAMIRLLRANGFVVEDLIELQVPVDAQTRYPHVTAEWAHRWPSEEVWKARKVG